MKKSLCVILLCCGLVSFGRDHDHHTLPPKHADAIEYVMFLNARRDVEAERAEITARLNTIAAERTRRVIQWERAQRLYPKGAITLDYFKESEMEMEVANAKFELAQQELDFNQAELELAQAYMTFALGEPRDLKKLFPIHQRKWAADCQMKFNDVAVAKSRVKLSDFRLVVAKKLVPTKAISAAEYERIEVESIADHNLLKAREIIHGDCTKDLPTLEDLEKLQTGTTPEPQPTPEQQAAPGPQPLPQPRPRP